MVHSVDIRLTFREETSTKFVLDGPDRKGLRVNTGEIDIYGWVSPGDFTS